MVNSIKQQNFVAKYARQFNRAEVHRVKTKYKRKVKHRKYEIQDV